MECDDHLAQYIEWLWEEGEAKSFASDAVAVCQYFMRVRKCFPRSWDLLGIWGRAELPCRAPPMPIEVLWGFAGLAWQMNEPFIALSLLLGYHCMLRSVEMGSVRLRCEVGS